MLVIATVLTLLSCAILPPSGRDHRESGLGCPICRRPSCIALGSMDLGSNPGVGLFSGGSGTGRRLPMPHPPNDRR